MELRAYIKVIKDYPQSNQIIIKDVLDAVGHIEFLKRFLDVLFAEHAAVFKGKLENVSLRCHVVFLIGFSMFSLDPIKHLTLGCEEKGTNDSELRILIGHEPWVTVQGRIHPPLDCIIQMVGCNYWVVKCLKELVPLISPVLLMRLPRGLLPSDFSQMKSDLPGLTVLN